MLSYAEQDEFRVMVKSELARRRMTIGQLSTEIGRARPTVQLAITRGLNEGTQRLIDKHLNLNFFEQLVKA